MSLYTHIKGGLGDILKTVVSGIILALLFFVLREVFFTIPNVNGMWVCTTSPQISSDGSSQYKALKYYVAVSKQGLSINGVAEVVSEFSSEIDASNRRPHAVVSGYISERYLFGKDRIDLHFTMITDGNTSTSLWSLYVVYDDDTMSLRGAFISTGIIELGLVTCTRSNNRWLQMAPEES